MSENDRKINEQLDKALLENKPASTTDCTGLMQGLPIDDEASDTSANMYNIPPTSNVGIVSVGPDSGGEPQKNSKGTDVIEP